MHLRFNCDGPSFSSGFSRGFDRAFTGKGARLAGFAQAFSDEFGSNWGGGPGDRSRAGPRRGRRYAITNAGRAALDDAKAQVADVLDRLAELAGAVRQDETQPLRRAFRNLKSAASARMSSDDADRALALKIAEILDEAAQRSERL